MLTNTQITYIKALQKASKENRLVVFAGAGTSADAGIPLWNNLVNQLASVLPENVRKSVGDDNLQLSEIYREVSDDKDYYDGIVIKSLAWYRCITRMVPCASLCWYRPYHCHGTTTKKVAWAVLRDAPERILLVTVLSYVFA